MKKVIIQKNDVKSVKWAEAAKEFGIELLPQPGSQIKAPLYFLQVSLRHGLPVGYVVRYLNNYDSLTKTILRLSSEILLIALCSLFKVKIFWICHNVDKETSAQYTCISRLRRMMFAAVSKRIFVTDQHLVSHAKDQFTTHAHKIRAISFGAIMPNSQFHNHRQNQAVSFIETKKREAAESQKKLLVTFCVGSPDRKALHFDYMEALIAAGGKIGLEIVSIVAGEFLESERGKQILKRYKAHPNIWVCDRFTRFSSEFILEQVDFYWRGYDDWSVPYTVYEAATLGKPTLALESGFLPHLVRKSKIGSVVSVSDLDAGAFPESLLAVSCSSFENFLAHRKWGVLSQNINEGV